MAKDKKKRRSLREGRRSRGDQSKKLEKRIKTGQERSKGRVRSIIATGKDVPMYRPKDGSHILDVVPYDAGPNDPLVNEGDPTYTFEYWAHTRIGPSETMMLCLAEMFNKPCPICEHRQKLREDGADDDVWKKLFPKRRNLYNIVSYDRGEEEKGIQVYDVSYHYFEKQLMAISKKPGRGGRKEKTINFADPENGRSITYTIEPAKSKNDYPDFVGHTFDDRDYEISMKLLKGVYVLDEIIHIPEYKELDKAYWGDDDKHGGKRGRGKKDKDKKKDSDESNELKDLLDELDDLDDKDELEDFIESEGLDVKVKKRDDEDDIKEKIEEALRETYGGDKKGGSSDEYDEDDIRDMKKKELKKVIKDEELDIDPDDAEDTEDLQDMVIEELDI